VSAPPDFAPDEDRPRTRAEIVAPGELRGQRVDQALASLLPQQSRSQLQKLIRDGCVTVDEKMVTRASHALVGGERIVVQLPAPVAAMPRPEAIPLSVLYEDSDIIVVDKPAGMVVHPAAGHAEGTLVNALLHHVDDLSGVGGVLRPGIVHRLDKGTSGLMVVAKHDRAHQALSAQFAGREVDKEYIALVWGVVQAGKRIDAAIGRDPHHRQRMSTRASHAREAVTRITRAEHLHGVTLAHVAIATGRTHQIRVHLQAIGHPVAGDALYGGTRRHLPAHLKVLGRLERPFLHAARLAFSHPADARRLQFEAPLPSDLQQVLDVLRRTAAR
jgi:23S rRNA pseudouridine1911/1915/1917 synthase